MKRLMLVPAWRRRDFILRFAPQCVAAADSATEAKVRRLALRAARDIEWGIKCGRNHIMISAPGSETVRLNYQEVKSERRFLIKILPMLLTAERLP